MAVATRGLPGTAGSAGFTRATCAFRADRGVALGAARRTAEICAETGASLRVATFGVLGQQMYPPEVRGEHQMLDAFVTDTSKAQDAAVAALPGGGEDVETLVATGRDWPEALGRLDWQDSDVLVVGSSPTGILARVFIGTNATRIVRHSPVPAVVVPR